MRVLVTGATGFIGGELVDTLVRDGCSVRALVRHGREGRFLEPNGVEVCHGDLGDADSLVEACRGVDVVVHTAGALGRWEATRAELDRINVQGVLHLLGACNSAAVGHLIHLSAGGVSGPMPPVPADETVPCRPRTAYEKSKLAGEAAALEFHRDAGLPLTILRPTFTYGPGDLHKLPMFKAVHKGRIALIGNGRSLIHPVFVEDVIRGIRCAIKQDGGTGETYLIGGPRPVTKRELLDTIQAAVGGSRKWLRIPRYPAYAAAMVAEGIGKLTGKRPPLTRGRVLMMGWSFGYRLEKAKEKLGYSPITDLKCGISRTVEWYREQRLLS